MGMFGIVAVTLVFVAISAPASAQIAVTSNDAKVMLEDGVVKNVPNPWPDTFAIIDLKTAPPRVIAEIPVPGSVVGPPFSVALTPDESLAFVSSSTKIDPNDPTKTVNDKRLTVIDVRANPPSVLATLEVGAGAAGIAVSPKGDLALVANRGEGTVSVLRIEGRTVRVVGKVPLGDAKSGPSAVGFTPDGRTALVTRDGDERISVLSVDGTKVEYTKRDVSAGLRPYGLSVSSKGDVAAVANIGRGGGDIDTISLIDLRANPIRTVETVSVGQTPEGIKMSPDGSFVAVVAMNGSNKPKSSPFYRDGGSLVLFRVDGTKLTKVAEASIGHWSQGAAFSPDGKTILVGNMVEKDVQVFSWDGTTLRDTGVRLPMKGGVAAIRTAER